MWSIVCFYLHPSVRHLGLSADLLDAAVEHATRSGARALESYPHERGDYMGSPELFAKAGFREVRTTTARRVMRRDLTAGQYR